MDTIVSPASAPVSQAVGIIRVSGSKALELSSKLLQSELPLPGTFAFRDIFNPSNDKLIDSGLVLVFKSPASFTGEDVVEFQLHGSPAVLEEVTGCLVNLGARRAEPGEFSFRAFVNGKARLPELELANALSNLKTPSGNAGISFKIESWKNELTRVLAILEAGISFPNDSQTDIDKIHTNIELVRHEIGYVLSCGKPGFPKIALAGKQNAGKSTLFNRLVGCQRMVVSEAAGTTRDFLSMEIEIGGRICQIFDGPGFEFSSDDSGQILYSDFLKMADVIVWLDPDGTPPQKKSKNWIFVKSKSDVNNLDKAGWVNICSKTGDGIDALLANISDSLPKQEYAISQRQYHILEKLENTLRSSRETNVDELIASDLQFAAGLVTELDGIGLSGEVLSSIFSTFCIGK